MEKKNYSLLNLYQRPSLVPLFLIVIYYVKQIPFQSEDKSEIQCRIFQLVLLTFCVEMLSEFPMCHNVFKGMLTCLLIFIVLGVVASVIGYVSLKPFAVSNIDQRNANLDFSEFIDTIEKESSALPSLGNSSSSS